MKTFKLLVLYVIIIVPFARCQNKKEFKPDIIAGQIQDKRLNEISGIVRSINNPGYFWVHNDSGDKARIFLISTEGKTVATLNINKAKNRDWEDITIGKDKKGKPYIFIGEIGDNNSRYKYKAIYRLPEPKIKSLKKEQILYADNVEVVYYQYEDGSRDAESIMFDPTDRNIYILSKREDSINVYKISAFQKSNDTITVPRIISLPITKVTAADISSDGKNILIKNYDNVYYWYREKTETDLSKILEKRGTPLPYVRELQGEAISWNLDGSAYITVSEKNRSKKLPYIYIYKRKSR